jgi:phenylacetate-coenzyme A ligase PaaK-like adenylate-forming protein
VSSSGRLFSVLQPLPDLVRELNAFQPSRVGGYPTALMLLADEQLAGRLYIQPTMLTPSGEWLAPAARQKLERVFGCPVRMVYSASEFMGIGFECARGWTHVNADWVILEPVDAAYRPVPPGHPSHTVLLTNLVNRVQPLIRYDLGDSIIVKPDPCLCGSPLQAIRIEGRKGDILYLPTPVSNTVAVLPLAMGTVLEETPGVRRAQVIQTGRNTLTVRLEGVAGAGSAAPKEVWDNVEQRLRSYLTAQGLPLVTITRAPEAPQQDLVSGKFRQIWSEVPTTETPSASA